jgi:deoxycytidylate deaminase
MSIRGKCAKQTTRCTIVTVNSEHIIGENWCENPQKKCPRLLGEDYEKCFTVCKQVGHAEVCATMLAGDKAVGAIAYLEGHTYFCQNCQETLFGAGVKYITIGEPPL